MTWLDEIEEDSKYFRNAHLSKMELRCQEETNSERMARVLREFVMGVKQAKVCFELLRDARQIKDTTFDEWFRNMSEDANELCVAARGSSRE